MLRFARELELITSTVGTIATVGALKKDASRQPEPLQRSGVCGVLKCLRRRV